MRTTTSAPRAASAGRGGEARAGVDERLRARRRAVPHGERVAARAAMLAAIGAPMVPRPRKATFMGGSLSRATIVVVRDEDELGRLIARLTVTARVRARHAPLRRAPSTTTTPPRSPRRCSASSKRGWPSREQADAAQAAADRLRARLQRLLRGAGRRLPARGDGRRALARHRPPAPRRARWFLEKYPSWRERAGDGIEREADLNAD